MRTCLFVFFTIFILQACNSSEKPIETGDSTKYKASDTLPLNTNSSTFKGLYTFGNEVNTFMYCTGNNKVYRVNYSLI